MGLQMLWGSTAETVVSDSLRALQQKVDDSRKSEHEDADEFRYRAGTEYVEAQPGESPADFSSRRKIAIDWVSFMIDALSPTYRFGGGPLRTYLTGSPVLDGWWRVWEGTEPSWIDLEDQSYVRAHLNDFWRKVDQETVYHGTQVIKVHWIDANRPPIPLLFGPWQVDVLAANNNPLQLEGIRILLNAQAESVTLGGSSYSASVNNISLIYEAWTLDTYYLLDQNWRVLSQKPNDYGFIPVLRVARDPLFRDFWCPGLHASVVTFCKELNQIYTELLDLMMHLFGQLVIREEVSKDERRVFIGKSVPLYAENGADRLSANTQLADFIAAKNEFIQDWALAHNIPPGMFFLKVYSARDPSGVAIVASQVGALDDRDSSINKWTTYERKLTALVARVTAVHLRISPAAVRPDSFGIAYPLLPRSQMSASEIREDQRFDLTMGIRSKHRVAMERDPSLTEDQALARIAEVDASAKPTTSVYEEVARQRFTLAVLMAAPTATDQQRRQIVDAMANNDLASLPWAVIDSALLATATGGGSTSSGD